MHSSKYYFAVLTGFALSFSSSITQASAPFSGIYAGVSAGPAWATSRYQTNANCPPTSINAVFCNSGDTSATNGVAVSNSGTGNFSMTRFNYDAHVGYNWLVRNYLLGGEAEFGGLNLGQTKTANGAFPFTFLGNSYSVTNSISTNWLATLRMRAGVVAKENILLFATGGVAWTSMRMTSSYRDNAIGGGIPGGTGSNSTSNTKTGWTLGAGGEWQFAEKYALEIEYLYVKFNSTNMNIPVSNSPLFTQTMQTKANLQTQIARVGVNYRFG